ncbi:MAG: response regulator [Actinobacteria bacterium]|nr:response regulator [Actinomycetota bacterium]
MGSGSFRWRSRKLHKREVWASAPCANASRRWAGRSQWRALPARAQPSSSTSPLTEIALLSRRAQERRVVSETIRLVIADDHPVVRDGLRAMLDTQPDIDVIGEASTGAEALSMARALRPDLVLMDLQMPELDGASATERIRAEHEDVQVLILTTYDTDADISRAVEAGATGYLLKDARREDLFSAIRLAARGESVLSPGVASRVLGRMRAPAEEALSSREIEVLGAVARGLTNREVARELHVSEATVKTHLLHVFAKLGVDDRTAAVTVALERGIIRLNRPQI